MIKKWLGILAIIPFFGIFLLFNFDNYKSFSEDFSYYKIIDNSSSIDIYLTDSIARPSAYDKLVNFLRNYKGNKEIKLILNTYGGELASGEQLINAINDAEARGIKVTSVVDTFALSMGAVLALSTNTTDIRPNSILMFHTVTIRGGVLPLPIVTNAFALLIVVSNGFLSETELDAIVAEKAVWISEKEAIRRLCSLNRLAGTKEYVLAVCSVAKNWAPEETIFEQ